jgi:hypothetical protein
MLQAKTTRRLLARIGVQNLLRDQVLKQMEMLVHRLGQTEFCSWAREHGRRRSPMKEEQG